MSHQRAALAIKNGLLADEIVPVPVPQRRGEPVIFDTDEGVRADTSAETLAQAAPFVRQGRHHHGRLGVADLRRGVRGRGDVGGGGRGRGCDGACRSRRAWRGRGPGQLAAVTAVARDPACARPRPGFPLTDLDLIEINEAFAAVAIQSMRDLRIGPDIVNVNGGAIALGHPIGMSGARLALHLIYELGGAAAGSARPRCAAAAARATPCCCGCRGPAATD